MVPASRLYGRTPPALMGEGTLRVSVFHRRSVQKMIKNGAPFPSGAQAESFATARNRNDEQSLCAQRGWALKLGSIRSVSSSTLFPTGTRRPNLRGAPHKDALVEMTSERGKIPHVRRGGWPPAPPPRGSAFSRGPEGWEVRA